MDYKVALKMTEDGLAYNVKADVEFLKNLMVLHNRTYSGSETLIWRAVHNAFPSRADVTKQGYIRRVLTALKKSSAFVSPFAGGRSYDFDIMRWECTIPNLNFLMDLVSWYNEYSTTEKIFQTEMVLAPYEFEYLTDRLKKIKPLIVGTVSKLGDLTTE